LKRVFQTRFGRPLGNCWAASIASILELPIEAVDWSADMTAEEIEPPGRNDCSEEWVSRQDRRLRELGFWMARQAFNSDLVMPEAVHYLVLGINRLGIGHVGVGLEGEIVHDPNPSPIGIATIEEIAFLVRR
jgi:hypothetical protein